MGTMRRAGDHIHLGVGIHLPWGSFELSPVRVGRDLSYKNTVNTKKKINYLASSWSMYHFDFFGGYVLLALVGQRFF